MLALLVVFMQIDVIVPMPVLRSDNLRSVVLLRRPEDVNRP